MKVQRQRKIVELITEKDIETQEELAKCLVDEGYAVTQATVSRDIRELNLTKVSINGGKQKYVLPHSKNMTINSKYIRVLKDGILSMTCAGNLLVVRTVAGMAMAVAAAIDAINMKEVVGCIAGDDTIMCAIRDAHDTENVKKHLESFII